MSKALGLLSGGLDSSLAAMVLKRQGVEVTCISFVTPFFGSAKAEKAARNMDIPLIVRDISEVHLAMVKDPVYGYGKNMNPCIDCHAMMFRLAANIMEEEGFDFLFSGEVLGQRPMSQNANALKAVAKHAGCADRILRPMSAKLLPPTPMEEQGLVDRERLLDIQGRSRKPQEALAKEWGLEDYPSSGGGCLLTEKSFSGRLRDLFDHQPDCDATDVKLLKVGRQFRLSEHAKLSMGRNESDNAALRGLCRTADVLLKTKGVAGPLGVVSGTPDSEALEKACALVASYSKGKDQAQVKVVLRQGQEEWTRSVAPIRREEAGELQIG